MGLNLKSLTVRDIYDATPAASVCEEGSGLSLCVPSAVLSLSRPGASQVHHSQFCYIEVRAGGLSLIGLFLPTSVHEMFVERLQILF